MLGIVDVDEAISVISVLGLAFLLFLAGLEIDFDKLRGQVLRLTVVGFVVSFGDRVVVALRLKATGLIETPLLIAIILCATSLGVLIPVLKDAGEISSTFGQLIVAAGTIADFGAVILLSIFFSGEGGVGSTLLLIGGLVAARGRRLHRRQGRRALEAISAGPAAPAGHDRADPRPRRRRPARRVRRDRRPARARVDPRRLHRRRHPLAASTATSR